MREIVLDTETTGFDPINGDRIVEIGCVELINHIPTDEEYHVYINPERDMPTAAFNVHGLSEEFLSTKPVFADVYQGFLEFIGDAPLVIHNASFDMGFLNAELKRVGAHILPNERAIDTLLMARKKYPGAQNSLDALCKRFSIDNSIRDKHGALIDSILLARVYLELIGGAQPGFDLAAGQQALKANEGQEISQAQAYAPRKRDIGSRLSEDELKAHQQFIENELGSSAKWLSNDN